MGIALDFQPRWCARGCTLPGLSPSLLACCSGYQTVLPRRYCQPRFATHRFAGAGQPLRVFPSPDPTLFRCPWGANFYGSFPAHLQRLRSGCFTACTRGLLLGSTPPAQNFFCASGRVCRFVPMPPARSRATDLYGSFPDSVLHSWVLLWGA